MPNDSIVYIIRNNNKYFERSFIDMVLQQINENKSWIQMQWKSAFAMQWPNILFATQTMLGTFQEPEVMVGDPGAGGQRVNPADRPEEKSMLRIRGYSTFFKGNISIVFHTKTNDVTVTIPKSLALPSDYQSLAMAIGPFVDSIELRMYAGK
jgi:hypothetical protein